MLLRALCLAILVCINACSEDESHFLDCGSGEHLKEEGKSYCVYSASLVASQGDAFACPEGTLARIDIDGAAVCTNVAGVDTVAELLEKLPQEALQVGLYGVGKVVIVDASTAVEQGELSEEEVDALDGKSLGYSANYAIIFKQDPADYSDETKQLINDYPEDLSQEWFNQFEIGYNCGRCVHAGFGFKWLDLS